MRLLLAIVSLFSMQSRAECFTDQDEPEHYSWELGVPDNQIETEVIFLEGDLSPSESERPLWNPLPEVRESFEPQDWI